MQKIFALVIVFFLCTGVFSTAAADMVNINTAPLSELDVIAGVGPTLAQRIIDARPFSSLDDLLRVKGIGQKTLQKIKDQGLAQVSGETIFIKEELPNKEKSDTTMSNSAEAAAEPLKDFTSNQSPSPISLFFITLGSSFILGAVALFWKTNYLKKH